MMMKNDDDWGDDLVLNYVIAVIAMYPTITTTAIDDDG